MGAKPCCSASPTSADASGIDEPVKHLSTEDDLQSKDNPGLVAEPAALGEEAKLVESNPTLIEPKLIQDAAVTHEAKLTEQAAAWTEPKLVQPELTVVQKSGTEAI